jgi:hypothetical protein
MHKCNRLSAAQRLLNLGETRDHQTRLIGEGQILQSCALQQIGNDIGQVLGNCDGAPETPGENLTPHGTCDGLICARNPDSAPGKLSLDIGHHPAFRVENETQKLVFPAAGALERTLPDRSCSISILL